MAFQLAEKQFLFPAGGIEFDQFHRGVRFGVQQGRPEADLEHFTILADADIRQDLPHLDRSDLAPGGRIDHWNVHQPRTIGEAPFPHDLDIGFNPQQTGAAAGL